MKKKKGIIYIYTNKINGMKYIGQTVNFYRRQKSHLNKKDNNHFNNSLQKNGLKNFEVWQSNLMSLKDMNFWEVELIKLYNTLEPNGYNIDLGGNGCQILGERHKKNISNSLKGKLKSEEHKKHLSENHADFRGSNSPMYGKHISDEVKEKMSKAHLGKISSFKGKHHTEESKEKNRQSNLRKNLGKNHWNSKSVICLNTLEIFDCIINVIYKYNIDRHGISNCCKGKQKSSGKLYWLYYSDYQKLMAGEFTLKQIYDQYKKVKI